MSSLVAILRKTFAGISWHQAERMAKKTPREKDPKKKSEPVQFYIEPELKQQADDYARKHGISLGALLRALLRIWTDPKDPRPLPPDIEKEKKRPSRKRKSG